jgi:hypothetical protein
MEKLRLDPEELAVESFESEEGPDAGQGTVRGHNWTQRAQDCTCYGQLCGTSAAPGEPCNCRAYSYDPCSSFAEETFYC